MATIFYRVRERSTCDYNYSTDEFYIVTEHRVSLFIHQLSEDVRRFMEMSGIVNSFPIDSRFPCQLIYFDISEKDKLEEFLSMLGHSLKPWS